MFWVFKSYGIPIQLLPLVNEKLKKMVEQGILEHVSKGDSHWVSSVVVLRKVGDLRICGDYKIGVNHRIFSDLFPIPNVLQNILQKLT